FIQNLSSRQVEEAFFRFLINTCLQCINHQSLFLFKKASDQLAHLVSVNGSLSISVYRQFIIDLALWEQNPSRFTQAHFITAANLLKSLHQGLLANQLLTYTDAFEESVINNHSRIISKPFILVL
ncbi:MAG TPA: hypothetical protein DCW31_04980, partial [Lactobacillus sp.]|nr:hypothetical protein [Lactobacillus sp.]